jgi:ribonucleoside-triphosphate reductase
MLEVWRAGDEHGHIFPFPKCDFHVSDETFDDTAQEELLDLACRVASENGVPYFIFDRDSVVLSACCRLRTRVEDHHMLSHPESLRFCGFQNVTVNLPQCALRAGRGNLTALRGEIDSTMDLCMKAHLQKKDFIRRLMSSPEMPLWEIGQIAADGRPYVDIETATYIIGIIGLNECVQHMIGTELHESKQASMEGLRVIAYMYYKAKELGRKYGLKVSLEESPAESAARRLAKIDLDRFPQAHDLLRGDAGTGDVYYTNSVHLRPDAPVDLLTRIRMQSKFHSLIESGAIIHAFVGEHRPSPGGIKSLVRKTHENTQAAQLTISPEFTICAECHAMVPGLVDRCPRCKSRNSPVRHVRETEAGPGDRAFETYEALLASAAKG